MNAWLIELVGDFPRLYWAGAGRSDWCGNVGHAVRFHDKAAAGAVATSLQIPDAHKVEAREHCWT